MKLKPHRSISGTISVPGDKSISHRVALLSLVAGGPIDVYNFADGADCQTSLRIVESLGVKVTSISGGNAPAQDFTLSPPEEIRNELTLDCGNSGTTARLLMGLLAGKGISTTLVGDDSLSRRPMERVADPLRSMGATLESTAGHLPVRLTGRAYGPLEFRMPVASAQVKSAMLFAGTSAKGPVVVLEDIATRDHSERLLEFLGADITVDSPQNEVVEDPDDPRRKIRRSLADWKKRITIRPRALTGGRVDIPGDISTAAFFWAAAAIGRGSVTVQKVGLNPTRTALLDHLKNCGCTVAVDNRVTISGEPRGDVTVTGAHLSGRKISGASAALLIDEIPIIAVMACFSEGTTIIRDVAELRVKESDRIEAIATNLRKMGAKVGSLPDGLVIEGGSEMQPCDFQSFGDHRIAMACSIASLFLSGESTLDDAAVVGISCPRFYDILAQLKK